MQAISNLLRSYLATQVAVVRDAISGIVFLLLAVGVLLLAIAFALLSAFWVLSAVLPQWQAALIMAAAALVAALLLRFVGMHLIRRRKRVQVIAAATSGSSSSDALTSGKQGILLNDPVALVVLAALAGIVIGRRTLK